jgi:hypothetical protein
MELHKREGSRERERKIGASVPSVRIQRSLMSKDREKNELDDGDKLMCDTSAYSLLYTAWNEALL